jgi:hypothetical protein
MRGNYVISYTARDGLRLHLDVDDVHDWFTAAPLADHDHQLEDRDELATVVHLPVGGAV